MRGDPVRHLLDFVRCQHALRAEKVVAGSARTLEEYREQVGFMNAMAMVESEIVKVLGPDQEIG